MFTKFRKKYGIIEYGDDSLIQKEYLKCLWRLKVYYKCYFWKQKYDREEVLAALKVIENFYEKILKNEVNVFENGNGSKTISYMLFYSLIQLSNIN